jgi:hypothetical protein
MPEYLVLCTGMNGILLVPSPPGERDRVRGREKKEPSPSPLSSPSRERRLFFLTGKMPRSLGWELHFCILSNSSLRIPIMRVSWYLP